MVEVILDKHKVVLFNSIEELSIERYHKFNKMLLVDAGIGSTIADFDRHLVKIVSLARENKLEEMGREVENMRQGVFLTQQELSPKLLSFAALTKSIDGEDVTDISDAGLKAVVERLKDEHIKRISDTLEDAKKKLDDELQAYFPNFYESARDKEYYDLIKSRTLAVLDNIIDPSNEKDVQAMTDQIITFTPTRKFSGIDNAEVKHDKQFYTICQVISQNLHREARNMTVVEYYSALEVLKEQDRQYKKALKKR